jgi:hypothetical protein
MLWSLVLTKLMTVTVATGDLRPSPSKGTSPAVATKGNPDWLPLSRFWVLESDEEEDADEGTDLTPTPVCSDRSLRYLCRSPSPVSTRDISEEPLQLARRAQRRIERQHLQRQAALLFTSPMSSSSEDTYPSSCLSQRERKGSARSKDQLVLLVLEPTIFPDDLSGSWTVVRRRRWSLMITTKKDSSYRSRSEINAVFK